MMLSWITMENDLRLALLIGLSKFLMLSMARLNGLLGIRSKGVYLLNVTPEAYNAHMHPKTHRSSVASLLGEPQVRSHSRLLFL
jgi:hypothetical protein